MADERLWPELTFGFGNEWMNWSESESADVVDDRCCLPVVAVDWLFDADCFPELELVVGLGEVLERDFACMFEEDRGLDAGL